MAQYDVFTNPSSSAADGIPYVVVIESDLLDALSARLTMPLAVFDISFKVPNALCPVIVVKGQRAGVSIGPGAVGHLVRSCASVLNPSRHLT